jgi:hypothetical protein
MSGSRRHAHLLMDRLPETQLSALVGFLETIVDPVTAALQHAPIDDQPLTEVRNAPSIKPASGSSTTPVALRIIAAIERLAACR